MKTYLCYTTRKRFKTRAHAKKILSKECAVVPPDALYPLIIECKDQATALKTYRA